MQTRPEKAVLGLHHICSKATDACDHGRPVNNDIDLLQSSNSCQCIAWNQYSAKTSLMHEQKLMFCLHPSTTASPVRFWS